MILVFIPIKKVHLVKTDLLLTVLLTVHSLNQLKRQILFFGSLVKLLVLAVKL